MKFKLPDRVKKTLQKAPPLRDCFETADSPVSPIASHEVAAAGTAAPAQVQPYVPWNGDAVPFAGPTELEAPGHRVQGRVIQSSEFTPPYQPYRQPGVTQQAVPARLLTNADNQWATAAAERDFSERLEAERRRSERWEAEQRIAQRRNNASTANIRRLRQLIREKYRLDVKVWSKRGVQRAMRPEILAHGSRSDEILQEIIFIVEAWRKDDFDNAEEWKLARKIKEGVVGHDGRRQQLLWRDLPPWDREDDVDDWEQSSGTDV